MMRILAGLFISSALTHTSASGQNALGAALLVVPAALGWGAQCEQKVTVRIQDSSVVPNPVWSQARNMAIKIFSTANVRIDWRTDAKKPGEGAIVVRMVAAPVDSLPGALASTQVYDGVHITVFWDRIEHPARPASMGVILAHVLVHEITHILQRIDRHSESGIMKAAWVNQDYRDMAWKPLSFTPRDIVLICLGRRE